MLDRTVTRFIAFGFIALWIDMAASHLSAGVHHPAMLLPLLVLPVAFWVVLRADASPDPASLVALQAVFYLAIALGILGAGLHLLSIVSKLRGQVSWGVLIRLFRYPPVTAPIAISALGTLGLLTARKANSAHLTQPLPQEPSIARTIQ